MIAIYDPATSRKLKVKPLSEVRFTVTPIPHTISVSGETTSLVVDEDREVTTITPAIVDHTWQLSPSILGVTFEAATPAIATVDADGLVTRVGDGLAKFYAKTNSLKKLIAVPVSRQGGQSILSFISWVDGSAAKHVTDNIETRIAGKTPETATLNIFSTANSTSKEYIRSSTVWCADYHQALTGCCAWQSNYGNGLTRAQTAITPRHIVGAAHYNTPVTIGGTIRFITAEGVVVDRKVTHTKRIGTTDIQLTVLDADLPASITPVKALPVNWADYLRNMGDKLPCLLRNQYGEARILDLYSLHPTHANFSSNMPSTRSAWRRTLVVGDSGGPAMLMVNGELALITTWTSPTSGPAYQAIDWPTEIAAIDALAKINTGYLPERIDLSSFTNYAQ